MNETSVFIVGGVLPLLLLPLLFSALPESIRFLVVHEAPREPIARLLNRIRGLSQRGAGSEIE